MKPKYLSVLTAAFALLMFNAQAQDPFTNGLVAYYPFTGNADDKSGFGRNGIISGGVILTYDRYGVPASALAFGTTNTWVRASSPINDVSNNFTMNMWFKAVTIHRTNEFGPFIIFPAHGVGTWSDSSVGAGISAGTNQIGVWEHTHDYNPKVITLDGYFPDWTMVTLVYSNRIPRLFTNGVLAVVGNQSPNSPVRPSNGQALLPQLYGYEEGGFGGYHQAVAGGGGSFFTGNLDDIRIYNRDLSSSQVKQLYELEFGPRVSLLKAVRPLFSGLWFGTNYQLQLSGDLNTWTNHGSPFTATNASMIYPEYWDVDNWGSLFFRLQVSP